MKKASPGLKSLGSPIGQDRAAARKSRASSKVLCISPDLRKSESYHHGNLRDALIECGLFLLDTAGLESMSLRGAARLAGVSQTAPRNHFQDKRGLLAAIASKGFGRLTEHRLAMQRQGMSSRERLQAAIMSYVSFSLERPALFKLMFGSELADKSEYPELQQAATASFAILTNAVEAYCKEAGMTARPIELAAFSVWSATHGLATLLVNRQLGPRVVSAHSIDELCKHVADVVVGGLTVPTRAHDPTRQLNESAPRTASPARKS